MSRRAYGPRGGMTPQFEAWEERFWVRARALDLDPSEVDPADVVCYYEASYDNPEEAATRAAAAKDE